MYHYTVHTALQCYAGHMTAESSLDSTGSMVYKNREEHCPLKLASGIKHTGRDPSVATFYLAPCRLLPNDPKTAILLKLSNTALTLGNRISRTAQPRIQLAFQTNLTGIEIHLTSSPASMTKDWELRPSSFKVFQLLGVVRF